MDDVAEFLKDGETVRECILRNRADIDSLMVLYGQALKARAEAEAKLVQAEQEIAHLKDVAVDGLNETLLRQALTATVRQVEQEMRRHYAPARDTVLRWADRLREALKEQG
jgi:7-cyano-7-deazaguanine synthase in queuosine biosynthesis